MSRISGIQKRENAREWKKSIPMEEEHSNIRIPFQWKRNEKGVCDGKKGEEAMRREESLNRGWTFY